MAFAFVKSLQARDLIIPVVGDLAGPHALAAIGRLLASERQALSAFYVSNVEFYLYAQGTVGRFVRNLDQVPRTPLSVVIRSVLDRFMAHARRLDASSSQTQRTDDLLHRYTAGQYRSYSQLVADEVR